MMNRLQDIKKLIRSVIDGGDILFIVPPFAQRGIAVLGPHVLQSFAEEAGYKTDILYLNILLASILGGQFYDDICYLPTRFHWMMLGERLFARSAYGFPSLGQSAESITDEAMCMNGASQQLATTSFASIDWELEELLKAEEICASFVNEAVQAVASLHYKIIGCTTMLEQTNCSIAMLNGIKAINPATVTLIGGTNCDGRMAKGIASLSQSVDYVFSGDSELSFKLFLQEYSRKELPSQRIIPGGPLKNLDSIACPNYESFFRQITCFFKEKALQQMTIAYETSRGCWWGEKQKCSFCGLNSDAQHITFRQKSEGKMLSDLDHIVHRYPVTSILMTDNIMPPSYFTRVLPTLSEKKDFPEIWYEEKANLSLQDLRQLKATRVHSTLVGIESLSTGLLKLMKKGVNARQNLLLLRNACSVGINAQWYMLWGFPGDNVAYYQEILILLPLIRHFHPPVELLHLRLARFSMYVEQPECFQIANLRPLEVYKNIYPHWSEIDKLAYYFSGDYPCGAHEHPEIIREIVNEIAVWKNSWKTSTLVLVSFADYYMIYDNRGPGKSKHHMLEPLQAKEIMKYEAYTDSEYQQWAVQEKLGVVIDGWYVPLVAASPELLLQFEETLENNPCEKNIA